MVKNQREIKGEENTAKKLESETQSQPENRGKLILDASCAPADISYPTDLNLLNQGRQQTEKIIDILYETLKGKLAQKPRTYRLLTRKSYLEVAKKRKPPVKKKVSDHLSTKGFRIWIRSGISESPRRAIRVMLSM